MANKTVRYNPLADQLPSTEIANRIANLVCTPPTNNIFREFEKLFIYVVTQALSKLGKKLNEENISKAFNSIDDLFIEYTHFILNENSTENWATQVQVIEDNINEKDLSFALKGRDKSAIALMKYIETNDELYDPVLDGLLGAFRYDKTYYKKITASLIPLLCQREN